MATKEICIELIELVEVPCSEDAVFQAACAPRNTADPVSIHDLWCRLAGLLSATGAEQLALKRFVFKGNWTYFPSTLLP